MNRVVISIVKAGLILIFAVLGFFVAQNNNFPTKVNAQTSCTTPAQIQGVQLTFPYCDSSGNCTFNQANCTWSAQTGASNYSVTVTNSTTSTQVLSQTIAAGTTNLVFNVQANNTYTCNVSAVNSCGTSGPAGSISLLCAVDALVDTVAPTSPPAAPPPAAPPPAGVLENTLLVGLGVMVLVMGGLFLVLI